MKKILVVFVLFISLLSGCSNQDINVEKEEEVNKVDEVDTKEKDYKRDSSPGGIVAITLDEMQQKAQAKESFAITFTTTYCGYCYEFHSVFDEYIKTHNVTMYEVVLDKENRTEQENLEIILQYFPEFYTTPGVFYMEDGVDVSYLDFASLGMNETVIDEWVQEYRLDEKRD